MANTLAGLLREKNSSDGPAILAPGRSPLSYSQLNEHVSSVAAELNDRGIGRNDRVAIVLPNGPEMATAFLAVATCATSAPLNPAYQTAEFDFYLTDLGAKALLVSNGQPTPAREVAKRLNIPIIELSADPDRAGLFTLSGETTSATRSPGFAQPDDVALVLHTSGTTSRPKIVPLTHRNILASANNISDTLRLTPEDRCLNVMVLFHIHGLMAALMASIASGASVVCTPGFLAPRFFEWLKEFSPTWYTAVPTIHQSILGRAAENKSIIDLLKLRFIRSSSASLAPSVMAELEKTFGAPVIEAYGMTEASHQMTSNQLPPKKRKPGTVGIAAGPEVAIMHEQGAKLLSQGDRGEIVIRGDNVTRGYANNDEANRTAFDNGWFRTGDQGFFDDEGYLTISGRLKEIINRGGEKILPREIDEVLLQHPDVKQAVTFGVPNPVLEEEVGAAVITTNPSITPTELRRFVAERLAPFKVPHQLVIVDEIPKGATGKMQRIGMSEKLGLTASEMMSVETPVSDFVNARNQTERQLSSLWCDLLNLPEVSVTQRFLDSGGDSMTAARLIMRMQEEFSLKLSVVDLFDAPTIREQAQVVDRLRHEQDTRHPQKALRLIQSGSNQRHPMFLFPGGGGGEREFLIYARLINLLGPAQTVYGGFAPGQDGFSEPHTDVKSLVQHYVIELRTIQPDGPYVLVGECIGGSVAYELARRLDDAGEQVHLLLMNTQFQEKEKSAPDRNYWLNRVRFHWKEIYSRKGKERLDYVFGTLKASPINPVVLLRPDFAESRHTLRSRVLYNEMLIRHQPSTAHTQPITLVVSEDYHAKTPAMGIDRWANGGLDIRPVPGDLDSYLGVHIDTSAAEVRDFLERANDHS